MNPYDVLGVERDSTNDDIDQAARRLASKLHPDRNPGEDTTARMADVNKAREYQKDPEKACLLRRVRAHGPGHRHDRGHTAEHADAGVHGRGR